MGLGDEVYGADTDVSKKGLGDEVYDATPGDNGLGKKLSGRWQKAKEGIHLAAHPEGGISDLYRPGLRVVGAAAGAASDVLGSGINFLAQHYNGPDLSPGENYQPSQAGEAIKKKAGQVYNYAADKWKGFETAHPENAQDIKDVANIGAWMLPGKKAEEGAEAVAGRVGQDVKAAADATKRFVKPAPTVEEATGQVLRGKPEDILSGEKAFAATDITGLKTYPELQRVLDRSIPYYARQVDEELLKDPKAYSLDELKTVSKSTGGLEVEQNYVKTALKHLEELYTKTEDPLRAQNVSDLLEKAKTQGLTKKEVNDIARQYGYEFKQKAFNSKSGESLTSVNAQAYENVRSGLKDVARRGMSDKAKELDETMSHIYNTKRLIDQNVEKVNELRQKTDPRSLGQKLGRGALDVVDTLTMGIVKGAILKMMPRGMGYKVKNWLDTEESLARNLKIIDKALNAKTAKDLNYTAWEARKMLPKGGAKQAALPPGKYPPLPEAPGSTPWMPPAMPMGGVPAFTQSDAPAMNFLTMKPNEGISQYRGQIGPTPKELMANHGEKKIVTSKKPKPFTTGGGNRPLTSKPKTPTEQARQEAFEALKDKRSPLYHFTSTMFDNFKKSFLGTETDWNTDNEAARASARLGFWFTDNPEVGAKTHSSIRKDAHVEINNPYRPKGGVFDLGETALKNGGPEKFVAKLKAKGHDGIVVNDDEFGGKSYIAFEPEQIKLLRSKTRREK